MTKLKLRHLSEAAKPQRRLVLVSAILVALWLGLGALTA